MATLHARGTHKMADVRAMRTTDDGGSSHYLFALRSDGAILMRMRYLIVGGNSAAHYNDNGQAGRLNGSSGHKILCKIKPAKWATVKGNPTARVALFREIVAAYGWTLES